MGKKSKRKNNKKFRRTVHRKLRRVGGDPTTRRKFKKSMKKLRAVSAFTDARDAHLRRDYRRVYQSTGIDTNPFSLRSKYPYTELEKKYPNTPPHILITAMERDPDMIRTRRDERAYRRRGAQEIIDKLLPPRAAHEIASESANAEQRRRIAEYFVQKKHGGGRRKRNRSNRRRRKQRRTRRRKTRRGGRVDVCPRRCWCRAVNAYKIRPCAIPRAPTATPIQLPTATPIQLPTATPI